MKRPLWLTVAAITLSLGCTSTRALEQPRRGTTQEGLASWYGGKFHGRTTASGEVYDMNRISAAHKQLPFGTIVEVSNRDNGRKLQVPINDRGPFVKGRIIDLSLGAARELGMFGSGLARVSLTVVRPPSGPRRLPISRAAKGGPPNSRPAGWQAGPARAAAAGSGATDRSTVFTVQAGAFREERSAQALARRLRKELGIDRVRVRKRGNLYRVQIDRQRRKAADLVRRRLKQAGIAAIILQ